MAAAKEEFVLAAEDEALVHALLGDLIHLVWNMHRPCTLGHVLFQRTCEASFLDIDRGSRVIAILVVCLYATNV